MLEALTKTSKTLARPEVRTPSWLKNLNAQQRVAVLDLENPLLVLAGAGSGKTRVITYKIAYLIDRGIPPDKILAITFTKKSAEEMQRRVKKLTGVSSRWISTFHSFCLKLLREFIDELKLGIKNDFFVYDEEDARELFKMIVEETGRLPSSKKRDSDGLFSEYSKYRQSVDPEKKPFSVDPEIRRIVELYENALIESNALDFDNLQIYACRVLDIERIRASVRRRFKYVLVDEFQDTSPVQYELVRKIADRGNITVVGDFQQSIYSFRGACAENIRYFVSDYRAKIIKLETNYRSRERIVDLANRATLLLPPEWNPYVLEMKSFLKEPGTVEMLEFNTRTEEIAWLIQTIKKVAGPEGNYSPIAILFRMRSGDKNTLVEELRKAGVAVKDFSEFDFFQRKEIKNVLSFIRLAINPRDRVSFSKIVKMHKGVGEKTVEKIERMRGPEDNYLQALTAFACSISSEEKKNTIRLLSDLIRHIRDSLSNPTYCIDTVLRYSPFVEYLKKERKEKFPDSLKRIEELKTMIASYSSVQAFMDEFFLEGDEQVESEIRRTNAVKVMTIHSAKGLEFGVVFLPFLDDGLFPHSRSAFDEEVRCFYVALTRAREQLYLSTCRYKDTQNGKLRPNMPSLFFTYSEGYIKDKAGEQEWTAGI